MIIRTRKYNIPILIDDADYQLVSQYKWCLSVFGYPVANSGSLRLPILLMGSAKEGYEWDHKNRDKLDNRRENLREVTRLVNIRNQPVRSDNTSGFKGISFCWSNYKWRTTIHMNGRQIHVGYFEELEEAVAQRMKAEEKYWGSDH